MRDLRRPHYLHGTQEVIQAACAAPCTDKVATSGLSFQCASDSEPALRVRRQIYCHGQGPSLSPSESLQQVPVFGRVLVESTYWAGGYAAVAEGGTPSRTVRVTVTVTARLW